MNIDEAAFERRSRRRDAMEATGRGDGAGAGGGGVTTLEWVTNAPADPEEGARATDMSRGKYLAWRKKFIELEPQATTPRTSRQLREMGMVWLYRERRGD